MKKGFSLIEVIMVLGIVVVTSAISTVALFKSRNKTDLDYAKAQISFMLSEAQSRAMNQENGESWGVRFANSTSTPYLAMFYGSYSTSSEVTRKNLPSSVQFNAANIPLGTSLDILFAEITGKASGSTTTIGISSKISPFTSFRIEISQNGSTSYFTD